jgi:hypothetical protein
VQLVSSIITISEFEIQSSSFRKAITLIEGPLAKSRISFLHKLTVACNQEPDNVLVAIKPDKMAL